MLSIWDLIMRSVIFEVQCTGVLLQYYYDSTDPIKLQYCRTGTVWHVADGCRGDYQYR
jgi:hypothetical protein